MTPGSYADIGFVKTILTDVYGYDSDLCTRTADRGRASAGE